MQTINIAGIDMPRYSEDPGWIPETRLVLTPTTTRNLQKILHPLKQGYNLLLVGDAGVGKNALIYYINQLRSHPTIRYSFNEDTLPEDLVGAYRIDPATHSFVWSDGPLAYAMRRGGTFVADEMNLSPPEVLKRFYSVFTDRSLQLLEGDSSEIAAGPGFNFVATQNPAEGFEGRKNLPREIQKYFATIYVDPYPHDELVEILSGLHPDLERDLIDGLVRANDGVERLLVDRKIASKDLERYHFNIRNLGRLASRLGATAQQDAGRLAVEELSDIYMRPFRADEDQRLVFDAIQAMVAPKQDDAIVNAAGESAEAGAGDSAGAAAAKALIPWPEKFETLADHGAIGDEIEIHINSREGKIQIGRATLECEGAGDEIAFRNRVNQAFEDFPPVRASRPVLESIGRALEFSENILLECEADVEPEDYVHFFADLLGRRMVVITLSRGMHTADILGGLKPNAEAGNKSGQSQNGGNGQSATDAVRWVDGPLTAAVRRGDLILLKGLEAAGPELVEKLNMLLDDAKALALPPESGETDPLYLKPGARIFAQKFFRLQRSTPSISRAFRNRFTALVVPPLSDDDSLKEIVASRLGVGEDDADPEKIRDVVRAMVNFHTGIRERSDKREIGSGNLQPYQFGLTNLRRWCEHVRDGMQRAAEAEGEVKAANQEDDRRLLHKYLIRGAGVAYINEISDPPERERVAKMLESLLAGLPLESLLDEFRKLSLKKKLNENRKTTKKIWWDQEEHWREANTGKFKPKMMGQDLKKGVNIDTPETGGNTKEGEDAWYGSDTQGNQGQGEPGAGGGSWGYRTEELYKEFLKKRRALWEYNIGVTLEDFKEIFEGEINRVTIDFDRLLDPQIDINRRYMSQGSRVDARRYLSYLAGRGDGRVFDKTTVTVDEDRLKGVEIIFAVNKGRRIFNFEYSIATLVAIMSCAIILENHQLPFGVAGYSDLTNMKKAIDLNWFRRLNDDTGSNSEQEAELFYGMAKEWHGDTVAEAQVLEELAGSFTPEARTRIIVMISDFRGARGKVTMEKDMHSDDTARLKQTVLDLTKRGIVLLGVGTGARTIADYVFPESVQVGGENFANLPALMAGRVTDLVHKHHNAAVM
ncbi:MAG: AAA family ATPase [bacterium]|nr:AAA family ATPase [bacterium]